MEIDHGHFNLAFLLFGGFFKSNGLLLAQVLILLIPCFGIGKPVISVRLFVNSDGFFNPVQKHLWSNLICCHAREVSLLMQVLGHRIKCGLTAHIEQFFVPEGIQSARVQAICISVKFAFSFLRLFLLGTVPTDTATTNDRIEDALQFWVGRVFQPLHLTLGGQHLPRGLGFGLGNGWWCRFNLGNPLRLTERGLLILGQHRQPRIRDYRLPVYHTGQTLFGQRCNLFRRSGVVRHSPKLCCCVCCHSCSIRQPRKSLTRTLHHLLSARQPRKSLTRTLHHLFGTGESRARECIDHFGADGICVEFDAVLRIACNVVHHGGG